MDNLCIITRQALGVASIDNFDEIKSYLATQLENYKNLAYTEDSLKIVKAAKRAGVRMENTFFDTYLYAKRLQPTNGRENVKLENLSKAFGIEQNQAHRAWCDAEANVGVYFKLKELGDQNE